MKKAKNNPNKIAIIWEGDDPNETLKIEKKITYKDLLTLIECFKSCKCKKITYKEKLVLKKVTE